MKGYTDFIGGMITSQYKPTHNGGPRYMDWEKVKQICEENPDSTIYAGLREDWNNTSGIIFAKGDYYNGYVYDQSRWATPIVDVDGTEIEVWTNKSHETTGLPGWWGNGAELKSRYDFEDDNFDDDNDDESWLN